MTKKTSKAKIMASLRDAKEKRGECRQCKDPVARHPVTGAPRKCCPRHLKQDAFRNSANRDT